MGRARRRRRRRRRRDISRRRRVRMEGWRMGAESRRIDST